jgi:hypothetical protein
MGLHTIIQSLTFQFGDYQVEVGTQLTYRGEEGPGPAPSLPVEVSSGEKSFKALLKYDTSHGQFIGPHGVITSKMRETFNADDAPELIRQLYGVAQVYHVLRAEEFVEMSILK